jgi:hypothetical protein
VFTHDIVLTYNQGSTTERHTMQALIDKYIANPSDKLAARIKAHADKHPFSTLMVTSAGAEVLRKLGVQ